MRWNINVRVLLVALVPALIIAIVLGLYFTRTRVTDLEQALEARGLVIARQLSLAAEFGVYSGNREALRRLATAVARDVDVVAVTIRDADNKVLANSGAAEIPSLLEFTARTPSQSEDPGGQLLITSVPILQSQVPLEDFFDARGVDTSRDRLLGRAYVAISRSSLSAQRRQLVLETLSIALLILVANVFLAVRMSRNVARPVTELTHAVRRLADGDFDARVTPDSDGVIRELENGVNAMASALKAAQTDLQQRVADATAQLAQKKEEAETANRAKSRFLAAASHDLRQPLHALGLFVASLRDKPISDDVRRTVSHIEKSVTALQDLLDVLLDISRLDAGTVTPKLTNFPVYRVLSAMEAGYALHAEQKGVAFRTVPSSALVRSDPILLERILLNLVSNAVRYTERGKILLGCRRSGPNLRIEVWDTGVGIAPDQQRLIFDEFYRAGAQPADTERGLGLGLAIVERLAQLLGHVVTVRSEPDHGSMFAIEVPLATGPETEVEAPPAPSDSAELAGLSVMVIDDDPAALRATQALFEGWGCRVLTAVSGADAESQVEASVPPPDIYICDFRLSHAETAIDVLDRLRTRLGRDIRAVVVSADTSSEVRLAVDASGYPLLHKPLRPAKLRALMQYLLKRAERSH